MTTKEFKDKFDHVNDGRNDRVVLVTNNPSVGGRYRIPISYVSSGFDWENGDILLEVEEEIYSKRATIKSDISKFVYSIPTEVWQKIRSSQGDAECRRYLSEHYKKQIK